MRILRREFITLLGGAAIGELSRPLGEDVLAECMVEFREMAISVTDFRLKDRPFAYPPVPRGISAAAFASRSSGSAAPAANEA